MEGELGVLQVEKKIRGRVKRQMEKTQREYYLNEQMKEPFSASWAMTMVKAATKLPKFKTRSTR